MIYSIFNLIVDTIATVLAALLLLRFWMQAVRVRPPLSLGQFMFRLTDWLVLPLRRLLPGLGGYDWASLLGALLVALISIALELAIRSAFAIEPLLLLTALSMVHWIGYGFIGLLFSLIFNVKGKSGLAFIFSGVGMAGIILTAGVSMFPFIGDVYPSASEASRGV